MNLVLQFDTHGSTLFVCLHASIVFEERRRRSSIFVKRVYPIDVSKIRQSNDARAPGNVRRQLVLLPLEMLHACTSTSRDPNYEYTVETQHTVGARVVRTRAAYAA